MLRLAARMRSRPGMRMPAALASRRLGMRGMRFATHASLAGLPFGGAPLSYLAATRQPLHLQYRLNWQGRIQVMRDLSALLVERVLHTRVMNLVERLLGRLAPALRSYHGRSASPRSIVDRLRRQREGRSTAGPASLRAAVAPHMLPMSPTHANPRASVPGQPHANRQARHRVSWPAARFGRGMRGSNVRIDTSHVLLRHVRETLRLLHASTPDGSGDAAYAAPGSTEAIGLPLRADHPSTPMLLALRAAASPRFVLGLRGGETLLRWLRASRPSPGSASGFGAAFVRYLHTAMVVRTAPPATQSSFGVTARGLQAARRFARMVLCVGPQMSSESHAPEAAPGSIFSAKPIIAPRSRLAFFGSAHAPGKPVSMLINLFVSRLSRVVGQQTPWRPQASGRARERLSASRAGAQEAVSVPALLLQRLRKDSDIALPRAAGFARSNSPSRRQRLSLASRLLSRQQRQAAVTLVQGFEPALAATYGRGQPPPVMAYRETPRPLEQPWTKQVQRIEQQITRNIVQNITQAMPWRSDMEKAVLTPRVMRELAEQVGGMMTQRIGLERYRRGL